VGISESAECDVLTNVINVKLRNQMGSQKSPAFPEGKEPFETSYRTVDLCLRTMTIPVPRLKLRLVGSPVATPTPQIIFERRAACVWNLSERQEAFAILKAESEIFEIKHRIRRHAEKSLATLELMLELMKHGGDLPLCPDRADRFEAYLLLRSPEFLRDLLALLDMADPLQSEPILLQAA